MRPPSGSGFDRARCGCSRDTLRDGAHVLHVSVQLEWVYVKVLTPDGHFRTRRYRHDALVEVQ
jgi:hypothetical protein